MFAVCFKSSVSSVAEREVSLDELMGVCQRLMDQQGKWVNIHLERNAVVLNPPKPSSGGKAPLALPAAPHAPGSEKGESKVGHIRPYLLSMIVAASRLRTEATRGVSWAG